MLKAAGFVFYTELLLLLRRSQEWLYPLGFFIIVISLFPLAFSPSPTFLKTFAPGCVWIAALFASLLSLPAVFFSDTEEGYLEQLLLSEPPLAILMLAKITAIWLVTALPLVLLAPLVGWLFHLSSPATFALTISLLLGTPILTLVGMFIVALTLGLRQQGVLLGLLVLPLTTPVLVFGVTTVQQASAGFSIIGPLAFLAGLALLAITLLPIAIAATVRISLDD